MDASEARTMLENRMVYWKENNYHESLEAEGNEVLDLHALIGPTARPENTSRTHHQRHVTAPMPWPIDTRRIFLYLVAVRAFCLKKNVDVVRAVFAIGSGEVGGGESYQSHLIRCRSMQHPIAEIVRWPWHR